MPPRTTQNRHTSLKEAKLVIIINMQNNKGRTPLANATLGHHGGIVIRLLVRKPIDLKDEDGRTALSYAMHYSPGAIATDLIDSKDDRDGFLWCDHSRLSPLAYAARFAPMDVIDHLLQTGVFSGIDKAYLRIYAVSALKNGLALLKVHEVLFRDLHDDGTNYDIKLCMSQELGRCLKENFERNQELGTVLTISGTVDKAWATTCDTCVKQFWPDFGPIVVQRILNHGRGPGEKQNLKIYLDRAPEGS